LDVRLSDLEHRLVREAQRIPETYEAGGVERIRALSDRVWFKVKTQRWRGAVTRLAEDEVSAARWWLGAGGYRRDGDPSDFYEVMAAAAIRDGRGSGGPRSDRWLPEKWDWKRLELEDAVAWVTAVRMAVGQLIARSLRTGRTYRAEFTNYRVTAVAHAQDGDTYLVVGAENVADPKVLAVVLDAVPGVDSESWQLEPGEVIGIEPGPGEMVWSTILPPASAARLLEAFPEE